MKNQKTMSVLTVIGWLLLSLLRSVKIESICEKEINPKSRGKSAEGPTHILQDDAISLPSDESFREKINHVDLSENDGHPEKGYDLRWNDVEIDIVSGFTKVLLQIADGANHSFK